ncbi:MAG: UDP-N-acetylglucosamine 4-epimerase [Phycisphaerae bacterium]|nr:UDP-N-acetylglucosamine 4-epimerase [Phycisphaerae bacterium]
MAKIVVTGAAGFIGSHLCTALLQRGEQVVGVDNFDAFYDPGVKRRNITALAGQRGFQLVEQDIVDAAAMGTLLSGADAVVHLAARAGVRPSIEQPLLYTQVNVAGTVSLLEAARRAKVSRFIFASSSSVYGNNPQVPFSESDNVDFPISPYAATKKAGELLCHTYHHLYGLPISCLRFFTVYGPRQRPDLAIHKFTRLIDAGQPIPVFGDGSMRRDHTYIDDIVQGTIAALDRCAGFNIYNLGESRPIRLDELIAAIERALGKSAKIERLPLQPGDVECTYADVSKAQRELGYEPRTELVEGLAQFVEWYRGDQAKH